MFKHSTPDCTRQERAIFTINVVNCGTSGSEMSLNPFPLFPFRL